MERTVRNPVLALVAPSRQVTRGADFATVDFEEIDAVVKMLAARGWLVKQAPNLRQMQARFAGSDEARAAGLNEALADPEVDLILAMRGGYGMTRLLSRIDWKTAGESFAVFVGLSDLTVFNLALLAKTGRASWQGPVARMFIHPNAARDDAFCRALSSSDFHFEMPCAAPNQGVQGTLWGGNLTMMTSLVGTEYFPVIDDGILFIEDVGEPAWRVERMLLQLALAGVLERQKAVLVGDFSGADKTAGAGDGRFSLEDALLRIREETGLPIWTGLPFGHRPDTMTLPVGVTAEVVVSNGRLSLWADHCPVPASVPWREAPPADLWWH